MLHVGHAAAYATVSLKPINSGFGTRFLVEGSGVGVRVGISM
jgi:hypothetical protein